VSTRADVRHSDFSPVSAPERGETSERRLRAESITTRALYLCDGPEPVCAFIHSPSEVLQSASAVVICPPFGWDEICSYRSRRDWANDLARAGFPTLRFDFPGSGDSGGTPRDPAQLSSWTNAVTSAAETLQAMTGLERVAAIGIGVGGLVACKAVAEGAEIDELVLWGVPSRGRTLLRELRAFASLEDSVLGPVDEEDLEPAPLPDGALWAGGFALPAATAEELERLDLTQLHPASDRPSRALMLERDGISADERLRAHLQEAGVEVTVAPGEGYNAMMAKPHSARPPLAVFARVRSWLEEPTAGHDHDPSEPWSSPTSPGGAARPTMTEPGSSVEMSVDGVRMRERAITVHQPFGDLFGILTEPAQGPRAELCAVLLNAGAIRHIGPNRMWVEAARRWAGMGVSTLRLDLEGIGDADGDAERFSELAELYDLGLIGQVSAALDVLEAEGLGRRFVLGGLCSGAHWSFHAALGDERVVGALMLNPQALFWDPSLEAARDLRRGMRSSSSWRKVLRGEIPMARVGKIIRQAPFTLPRRALARRQARRRGENELDEALGRLSAGRKYVRFIFSGNEPLYEELLHDGYVERLSTWPTVGLEMIPGRVHTLRPFQSQQAAHAALDRALGEVLQQTSSGEIRAG
jgi:pimeloyl-ACP methyl ester carboxylesterase